jgi:acetolactate synthase I/III small subunit
MHVSVFLMATASGLTAMPRTPIASMVDDDQVADAGGPVDASLLPPG